MFWSQWILDIATPLFIAGVKAGEQRSVKHPIPSVELGRHTELSPAKIKSHASISSTIPERNLRSLLKTF